MVLEGIVPVLMQTPPTTARDSITATRFFIFEAATAARWPEGPEPITARSYLTALMRIVSRGFVADTVAASYTKCRWRGPQSEATIPRRGGNSRARLIWDTH